jgi:hypothetical protein
MRCDRQLLRLQPWPAKQVKVFFLIGQAIVVGDDRLTDVLFFPFRLGLFEYLVKIVGSPVSRVLA